MKNLFFACLFLAGTLCAQAQILPKPASQVDGEGSFQITEITGVKTNVKGADKARLFHALEGSLKTQAKAGSQVVLNLNPKFAAAPAAAGAGATVNEGYALDITPKKVTITAASPQGLFYGIQSLAQLKKDGTLPVTQIKDEPRFRYRGLMLDCSRHFFGKDFIKNQIIQMAKYKLNRLHLHLTDAAGWRLQIDKYPELTRETAFRTETD